MSNLTLDDFGSEKRLTGKNGGSGHWTTDPMGPIIRAKVFSFSMKIHTLSHTMVGVMKPGKKRLTHLYHSGGVFSCGIYFYSGGCNIYGTKCDGKGFSLNIINTFGVVNSGDTVRFIVNKEEKTIHAQNVGKNEEQLIASTDTIDGFDFPEELQICCSRHPNQHQDVEIVAFECGRKLARLEEGEEVGEEEMERIDFMINDFGNIKIPLQNKELNLIKSFLIHSRIPTLFQKEKKEYRGLYDLNLNVDEKKIVLTILGKKVDYEVDELLDYFMFFRRLGMKREMKVIIDKLLEILKDDVIKTYEQLEKVSVYEEDEIKSWFSPDSVKSSITEFRIGTFNTSYCLVVFNILKDNFSKLQQTPELCVKHGATFGFVFGGLIVYKNILNPMDHVDFKDVKFEDFEVPKLFSQLYFDEKTSNMKLKTERNEFPCHREVLVYRLSHFKRMFEFNGSEREELLTNDNPVIPIEDMDSKSLQCILDFIYLRKMNENVEVSTLIHVIILSRKYLSPELEKVAVEKLRSQIKVQKYENEEDVVRILSDYSNVLYVDEDICKIVLPLLETWSGKVFNWEKMMKIIRKGFEHYQLHSKIGKLEEELKSTKKRVEQLERINRIIMEKLGLEIDGTEEN